jgi:hypothetical protein
MPVSSRSSRRSIARTSCLAFSLLNQASASLSPLLGSKVARYVCYQQPLEQALQRSPEGVVDDAGSVTAHPMDIPDDSHQIVQLDYAFWLDFLLQRGEQGGEFVGRFGDE